MTAPSHRGLSKRILIRVSGLDPPRLARLDACRAPAACLGWPIRSDDVASALEKGTHGAVYC